MLNSNQLEDAPSPLRYYFVVMVIVLWSWNCATNLRSSERTIWMRCEERHGTSGGWSRKVCSHHHFRSSLMLQYNCPLLQGYNRLESKELRTARKDIISASGRSMKVWKLYFEYNYFLHVVIVLRLKRGARLSFIFHKA